MLSIQSLTALDAVYTKDSLEKGLFKFVKEFYLKNTNLNPTWEDAGTLKITKVLQNKKSFSKPEVMTIAFSVFSNKHIYQAFKETLPITIQKTIEKLLWKEFITDAELQKYLGVPIIKVIAFNKQGGITESELLPEYNFFSISKLVLNGSFLNSTTQYRLCLNIELKKLLVDYYPKPAHYYFQEVDTIPISRYVFNTHPHILEELPTFIAYYLGGYIKYSATGRPMETTLSRFQKNCSIKEYYNGEEEGLNKVRTNLIAGLLFGFQQKNLSLDSVETIKYLFKEHYLNSFSSQYILSHLKGWGFVNDVFNDNRGGVEEALQGIIKQLHTDKWVSSLNILEFIEHRAINVKPIETHTAIGRLYYDEEILPNLNDKTYLQVHLYNSFISDPFIKGTLFLYAAWGLVELAYAGVNTSKLGVSYYSAYDGLMYCKLTSLGAYVLGKTDEYTYKEVTYVSTFTLSTDSLMIISSGNVDIAEVMLNNCCEKLGKHRYRVTTNIFLKECKTKKDVQNKIASFKLMINNTIPIYWERFFNQLEHSASLIKVNKLVVTYSLPIDDKELHKMIAQDVELKKLVLKAEGFNLLVPIENVPKFKTRMKVMGFVIE